MKTRLVRTRLAPPLLNVMAPRGSCSLLVLAGLGLLSFALPLDVLAQRAPAPNTLPVLRSVVSTKTRVLAPTVTAGGRSLLTIDQEVQRAIINWNSFNIGSNAEVLFLHRTGANASTLNRIYDAVPSVIQGRLSSIGPNGTPGGQIILINRNGILFNRGAQVNTQSLIASSLNMSNERFLSGALTGGGLAAFEGDYNDQGDTVNRLPGDKRAGGIVIGGGDPNAPAAVLQANAGGSIMVFAPTIENQGGIIKAPDGQVILAAGSKAYLALSEDSKNRGFVVEVEAVPDGPALNLTSLIRNTGEISADRGNVTLAGLAVNQDGRVSASTAIQANGSIYLKARALVGEGDNKVTQAGTVSLGQGSVTQVLPDASDKATLAESQSYLERRGEIAVQGRTITSSGTLQATGGKITLEARDSADPSGARVYLDAGSTTSVAGNWAEVPFSDNLLTFKVTSNELKDSPDQKTGILKGATVTVDLRKGSPLLNLDGYIAAQARTVAQKTAVGGELDISSSGSLIQRSGATLDASGGGYRYGAGIAATSMLLGADGRIYDIGSAAEMRPYSGQVDSFTKTYARWGQTQVYRGSIYGLGKSEAAYSEGKAGGSIRLNSAAGLVLDGQLKGGVTVGPNQMARAPRGATLQIGEFHSNSNEAEFASSQRIGDVNITQAASDTLGNAFLAATSLSTAQTNQVSLAADQLFGKAGTAGPGVYVQNAFDSVELNSNGRITVPAGVHIDGAPGSSLVLRAPQVEVSGSITMPAGRITLQPVATNNALPPELSANTGVTVRQGASLSTAGLWINNASADGSFVGDALPSARVNVVVDADGSTTTTTSSLLKGGSITIAGNRDGTSATLLEGGASLDVGGGAALSSARKITAGDGGTLSITNGLSSASSPDWLLADLSGLSAGNGGQLILNTTRVVIDPADAQTVLPGDTTRLRPELFSEHGFSSVTVKAVRGIDISEGAEIRLQQDNLVIDPLQARSLATGGDLRDVSTVERLPDHQRHAVNLTLSADGGPTSQPSTLTMSKGSSIVADPKATVALSAINGMQVDGHITAPGGSVSLKLSAPGNIADTPDLTLGASAAISVAGTFVRKPNLDGLVQGSVIGGGTVTIEAANSGVKLAERSSIDVSGLTQVVQSLGAQNGAPAVSQQLDGNAGALIVRSQGVAEINSALRADAGSPQGAGGAFALELTARTPASPETPPERRILVTQGAPGVTTEPSPGFVDASLSVDKLQEAGFQKLRLQSENRIELQGDVNLEFARGIRLDAPLIDVTGDGRASLRASSVAIGQSLDPREASGAVAPQGSAPVLPTRAGSGVLSVQADTIDLFGSVTLNGVAQARLYSEGDIRLTGRTVTSSVPGRTTGAQVGSLTTTGDILLSATQVYPSTRTDYTFSVTHQPDNTPVQGGTIVIAGNGKTAGDVYSAGGKLALNADYIVQGGTVKAPLGEIDLHAGSRLELSPGSLTSVSANGLTIPLGYTAAGISWSYRDSLNDGTGNLLVAGSADNKRIELTGPDIDVRAGATVDLSGGGDLQAREFVPGIGGSNDVLATPGTYAIIPKSLLSSMPVDTDLAASDVIAGRDIGFGLQSKRYDTSVYDQLHIGRGGIVPEGDYVLLPARYALLPDAYLVQLQTGGSYANMLPGQTTQLLNGQTVVAGYRVASGTTIRESSTVGVVVRPGSAATRESDYALTGASYFTQQASDARNALPRVPIDAGHLAIGSPAGAQLESLALQGSFVTAPGTSRSPSAGAGRLALIDISTDRIAVVDRLGAEGIASDFLQIEGASLSALGGSLLLGGKRTGAGDTMQIATGASQIVVANSEAGAVKVPELMLAASDSIELRNGSELEGSSNTAANTATHIKTDAGGGLLRLSSGAQATVDRGSQVENQRGEIRIAEGAMLKADRSLLLDATRTVESTKGQLTVGAGGSVSLASSQVSLGETAGLTSGLVLSNDELARLAALDALVIKGYQGIDLIGNARVGAASLDSLTLDAAAIRGSVSQTTASAVISAAEVQLINSGTQTVVDAEASAGSLSIDAQRIVVDAGEQRISGFDRVGMNAERELVAQGQGGLAVAGDWTVRTPKVGVAGGAKQTWRAVDLRDPAAPVYGAMSFERSAGPAGTSTDTAAGGRLVVDARSIDVATTLQAHAGSIALAAKGSGSEDKLTLANGALIDASGIAKDFNGRVVTADAGRVSLSAVGEVSLAAGSVVNVAASGQGGNAGALQVSAAQLALGGGQIRATAAAGAEGGRAALDLGTLADFSALNRALSQGGFSESIDLRLRSGDLHVGPTDVVKARELQLAADDGRIDIDGTLDASSARGGSSVSLWADDGLALRAGSQVLANGSSTSAAADAALSNGGTVRLSTAAGSLDFDADSTIDVSPGAKGRAGTVSFGVTRGLTDVVGATQLAGTVLGRDESGLAKVVLEATRIYEASGGAPGDIAAYATDHANFMTGGAAAGRLDQLMADGGVQANASVQGATELRSTGDLNLTRAWSLDGDWRTNDQAGTLTLRAAGNLTLSSSLGMANDNIIDGATWNLRLVGGADLGAANAMATVAPDASGAGSVLMQGNNAKLRTGTGTIEIAAATDFRMDSPRSVVYTAGRIGEADANNRWSRDGGSISIKAGRDAAGASNEYITEWLRRMRTASTAEPAQWWAYRPNFQQGIGTLGGGDIRIAAGRDVNQLSAMLPTTGRSVVVSEGGEDQPPVRQLDVQGGGDLRVHAGNNVVGGSYLVSRGDGRIVAGGDVGGSTPTQLFMMGVSSGDVPDHASLAVAAGGSIAMQSVNNPTALYQVATTPGRGPGFAGNSSRATTFFTYSPDSALHLLAQSGDVGIGSRMANARLFSTGNSNTTQSYSDTTLSAAFPATLLAAAFEDNISFVDSLLASREIVTYPSPTAQVALLAADSLLRPNLMVSDRSPDRVNDVNRPTLSSADTELRFSGNTIRVQNPSEPTVVREAFAGFHFDLQALKGDIIGGGQTSLPAESRIRAGNDITNVKLVLQNLDASDVSEVRADTGDVKPNGIEIRGPGTLLVQAGRNVDVGTAAIMVTVGEKGVNLGGIIATGSSANPRLESSDAARMSVIAGVRGDVDLSRFKAAYDDLIALNGQSDTILAFYRALNGDPDRNAVVNAASVQELAARDKAYAAYVDLVSRYPGVLTAYQAAGKAGSLPLGASAEAAQAAALYTLLNRETDAAKIANARSVADLVQGTQGGSAYAAYAALDAAYPRLFADYQARRARGAQPQGITPIILSDALNEVTAKALPEGGVGAGNIYTYFSSIQSYGNGSRAPLDSSCNTGQCGSQGDIDLWAPGGNIIAGLTTPLPGTTIGVVTNGGGAIRSVVGGDFVINQGKVLTVQGGDILIYSGAGSVDAGRGANTSLSTPPPTKTAVEENGQIVRYIYTLPASASGSGIQTLTSDPDGIGPLVAATPGSIYLYAPAGAIDAGEAGIRSSGNIVVNAAAVLNASNISSGGTSQGVPVVASGSLAATLASSGGATDTGAKAAQDAAKNAAEAARAATAQGMQKPTILTVEVMGFGDKGCKESECFGK